MKKKFPWDCEGCPMLASWDMSVDDITHKCLWSKNQIDDCDRYKYAECPMEKHDKDIGADERRKFVDWLDNGPYLLTKVEDVWGGNFFGVREVKVDFYEVLAEYENEQKG